jgi:hypothetical protein
MNNLLKLSILMTLITSGYTLTCSTPPTTNCDLNSNCFKHCCLSSGICPSSSCVSSLDAQNNANSNCNNKCLDNVKCNLFIANCNLSKEHCIGNITCHATCGATTCAALCFQVCNIQGASANDCNNAGGGSCGALPNDIFGTWTGPCCKCKLC